MDPASMASSLAEEGVKAALTNLWKQVSYVLNYKDNLRELDSRIKDLKDARTRLLLQVEQARVNRLEEIHDDVETWLKLTNEEIAKAEGILVDDQAAKKSCCAGLVPNVKTRHKFSRRAKKEAPLVEALKGKPGGFSEVGYPVPPPGIEAPRGYEAFESRAGVFEAVVQAFKEADMVGVWGLGGVGKTTLAKKIAEWAKADGMFNAVAMATLKQKPQINTIQRDIAERLGFEMKEESTEVRASLLLKRLKQEKSILIILDDVWEMVDLDEIGVPRGGSCKLLLTSRIRQVLSKMDASPKHCFPLDVLTKEEGWKLFQSNVGNMQDPAMVDLATEIVARCGGLPVLILPVAKTLKNNKDLAEWKDALRQLKKGDFGDNAFPPLRLSYNFLKEDEKSVFQLCGQVGRRNISVSDLFMYSVGWGLFEDYETLEASRNRLHTIVNNLKSNSLLEDNTDKWNNPAVGMHDVVYSFAISLASAKEHAVARDDMVMEWPRTDVHKDCTSICLPYTGIERFPQVLECPMLKIFHLSHDLFSVGSPIPESFFNETTELRVLYLGYIVSPLPSSLQFLRKLEALYLYKCEVEDISLIGALEKLQVLSLERSDLVYLPAEIRRLTCLRLLNLSDCRKLEIIPPNVLSCLTQLEELLMGESPVRWGFQDENNSEKRNTANLDELRSLPKLTRLEIRIRDPKIIPKNLFSAKLEIFKISVGNREFQPCRDGILRALNLELLCPNDWPVEEVTAVVKRAEELQVDVRGFGEDICKLDMEGFPLLKHLLICKSDDIRYAINSSTVFPRLESLNLDGLDNLELVCHGLLAKESLSNLRELRFYRCPKVKNVFSVSVLRALPRLQDIQVDDCLTMTEILVEERGREEEDEETFEFPQLHKLSLKRLPQLTSICSTSIKWNTCHPSQQTQGLASTISGSQDTASDDNMKASVPLFLDKVAFPNLEELRLWYLDVEKIWDYRFFKSSSTVEKLTELTVWGCNNLKYLFTFSMTKTLVGLKQLHIDNCKSMEEIIISEPPGNNNNVEEKASVVVFPKLEMFFLIDLPVTVFTNCDLLEFPNLKTMEIQYCHEMITFVKGEPSTTRSTALFDEKVLLPKVEKLEINQMNKMEMIWHEQLHARSFCKLEELRIRSAPKLLKIFPSSMLRKIHNLKLLEVRVCKSVEEVFDPKIISVTEEKGEEEPVPLPVVITNLTETNLGRLPELKHVWPTGLQGILSFENLREVVVWECGNLESVFPASMCMELSQLGELCIEECGLEHIIAVEQGGSPHVLGSAITTFEFPRLDHLILGDNPSLSGFYPEEHLVSLPPMKTLVVRGCPRFKISSQPEIHFDQEVASRQASKTFFTKS